MNAADRRAQGVRFLAPAKVNPVLRVLGRRADGFHELETTLLALDWSDEVTVAPSPEWRLAVSGPAATPDIPTDPSNLAVRAAARAFELARERGAADGAGGLSVGVLKMIPSQAGLGGGSADAAAALHATLALFGLDDDPGSDAFAREALAEIGSDCVFFSAARDTGAGLCRGRGERVFPCAAPTHTWCVALVVPALESPTAAVYAALGLEEGSEVAAGRTDAEATALLAADAVAARALCVNDLEEPALRALPELAAWRAVCDEVAPHFRLAGSGASFFGLFADVADARATLDRLTAAANARGLGVRVAGVTGVAGHGVARAH